jgi:hypothetical protein
MMKRTFNHKDQLGTVNLVWVDRTRDTDLNIDALPDVDEYLKGQLSKTPKSFASGNTVTTVVFPDTYTNARISLILESRAGIFTKLCLVSC